jgi:hypothetical protein
MVFFDKRIHQLQTYISDFLGNPLLHKLKDKDGEFSIYGVQVQSNELKEKLFLICKTKYRETKSEFLSTLPWLSIQTRTVLDKTEYDTLPITILNKNFNSLLQHVKTMKVEKEYRQDISMIDYTILNLTNVHVTIFYPQKKYCPDETNMEYLLNLFDTVVSIQKK